LKEIKIHMDGMETMVKLRGGIYNLGMNGALNEIICWYFKTSTYHSNPSLVEQSTNSPGSIN